MIPPAEVVMPPKKTWLTEDTPQAAKMAKAFASATRELLHDYFQDAFKQGVLMLDAPSFDVAPGASPRQGWYVGLACFEQCDLIVRWSLDELLDSVELDDTTPAELEQLADTLTRHAERLRAAAKAG